jgi:hypothetical protein
MRYELKILRREQMWMPAGLWTLFVLMVWLMRHDMRGHEVATVFLGAILPLLAGILAAPVVVEDPALELQFAAPRPSWQILVERLAAILAIAAAAALLFQRRWHWREYASNHWATRSRGSSRGSSRRWR